MIEDALQCDRGDLPDRSPPPLSLGRQSAQHSAASGPCSGGREKTWPIRSVNNGENSNESYNRRNRRQLRRPALANGHNEWLSRLVANKYKFCNRRAEKKHCRAYLSADNSGHVDFTRSPFSETRSWFGSSPTSSIQKSWNLCHFRRYRRTVHQFETGSRCS